MKEIARLLFTGDRDALENVWNARVPEEIRMHSGAVAVDKHGPYYPLLMQLVRDMASNQHMRWRERVTVEYSEQELEQFDLLKMHIVGYAGEGHNALAEVYDARVTCDACGRTAYAQKRNIVLDYGKIMPDALDLPYLQHDVCRTRFDDEVLVSEKLRDLLHAHQVSGISIRPVDPVSPEFAGDQRYPVYYQLLIVRESGPLVEPSPVLRLDLCEGCGQYRQVLLNALPSTKGSEFYVRRSSQSRGSLLRTSDRFGRVPDLRSAVLIDQMLYRVSRDNGVTGFWVAPVHLVDEDHSRERA